MNHIVLALVGPHGAGKTTVGIRVAEHLGWVFEEELGRVLRKEHLRKDPRAHAQRPQPLFDEEVLSREYLRDQQRSHHAVVETWHPGNLAYAEQRSPEVFLRWQKTLEQHARQQRVLVQPLQMDLPTARIRCSEPGLEDRAEFFLRVGQRAEELALAWGLLVLPTLDSTRLTVEELASQISRQLDSICFMNSFATSLTRSGERRDP